MGILYRDLQTGDIAWFINFWAAMGVAGMGVCLLALAVLFGDETALALAPVAWRIQDTSVTRGTRALHVLEQGVGTVVLTIFRVGLLMCACIIVHHVMGRIFRKKRRGDTAQ